MLLCTLSRHGRVGMVQFCVSIGDDESTQAVRVLAFLQLKKKLIKLVNSSLSDKDVAQIVKELEDSSSAGKTVQEVNFKGTKYIATDIPGVGPFISLRR
jgi:hypothetical protein